MSKITPTEKVYRIVLKSIKNTENNVANTRKTDDFSNYSERKMLKNELGNLHEIRRRIELIKVTSNRDKE